MSAYVFGVFYTILFVMLCKMFTETFEKKRTTSNRAYKYIVLGKVNKNTSEEVIYPNKLVGTTYSILNSNYKFGYWISDVDVLLDNDETIEAGNQISEEQLKSIIVTSDMVLTANTKMTYYTVYYKSSKGIMFVNDTMEIVYDGQGIKGVKYISSKAVNKVVYISFF